MRYTKKYKMLPALFAMLVIGACSSTLPLPSGSGVPVTSQYAADLPYTLNLSALNALDPKPLQVSVFSPDKDPKVKGFRVISTGRIFPFTYEVITIASTPAQDVLIAVSKSLDGHDDIVLKEFGENQGLGKYLHFFQRFNLNGKPHHVSSNYIFVKNGSFFHLSATSYGPAVMPRDTWGDLKPDGNAETEVKWLLKNMGFK